MLSSLTKLVKVMIKYSYAERVVSKLQHLTRDNPKVNGLLAQEPVIILDGNFELKSIVWRDTNIEVKADRYGVVFTDGLRRHIPLMTYKDFDALLEMK